MRRAIGTDIGEMLVCGTNIKSFIGFLSVQFALISRDNKYLYVRLGRKINHNVIEYARRCMKIKQSMSLMRQNPRKALSDKYQWLFNQQKRHKTLLELFCVPCFFVNFLSIRPEQSEHLKISLFINLNNI